MTDSRKVVGSGPHRQPISRAHSGHCTIRNLCTAASTALRQPDGPTLAAPGFSCIDKLLISLNFSSCQINRQFVESLVGQGFGSAGDRLSPKLSTESRCYCEKCRQIKHLRKSTEARPDADKSVDTGHGLGDKSRRQGCAFAERSYAQNWGTSWPPGHPLGNVGKNQISPCLCSIFSFHGSTSRQPDERRRPCPEALHSNLSTNLSTDRPDAASDGLDPPRGGLTHNPAP